MAVYKCKMCGGDLVCADNPNVAACDSCGTQQTLPTAQDEQKANLFNRANHLRQSCDFDRAAGVYESLLNLDNTDNEAHWGLLLSRYGIEYVEDPRTHDMLPTCHRVQSNSILADPDYTAAIEFAKDGYSRELYEKEAKRIAEIQRGILSIAANESPYDVFICYKETSETGQRTKDSALAQDIYYQLNKEGYKVFFSRITLEGKLGQEYEPYIFAALTSARVMLVIGTKPEYFSATWVKNEWSRYAQIIKKDRSKLLIPCYLDMSAYDLPDELAMLQSQDMSKIGFIQDLLHGIKKITEPKKEASKAAIEPGVSSSSANITSLYKRALIFLEDGEFKQANEYFDRILDIDPEHAPSYMGKLCVELSVKKEDDLANCAASIAKSGNFVKALRFADVGQRERYNGYEGAIQERLRREEEARLEKARREAEILAEKARRNAEIRAERERVKAEKRAEQAKFDEENRQERNKIIKKVTPFAVVAYAVLLIITQLIVPAVKMSEVKSLISSGNYSRAESLLWDMDKHKQFQELLYKKAVSLLNKKDYAGAISAFLAIGDYRDTKDLLKRAQEAFAPENYEAAVALLDKQDYAGAISAFEMLGDYKDAKELLKQALEEKRLEIEKSSQKISAGSYHTVGLKSDGTVVAVGENRNGRCDVGDWRDIVAVSAGDYHTVGLKSDGTVVAVGGNGYEPCNVGDWKLW